MSQPANGKSLPIVAIIGRPNVGKSTLFNSITGSRRAITGDEYGITRDRLYREAEYDGKPFLLVDTGGMMPGEQDVIPREIVRQAETAIAEADVVVFVVDAQAGPTPLDEEIFSLVRKSGKKVRVAVNKVDIFRKADEALTFFSLGTDEVFPVSAEHRRGLDELLDAVTAGFPVVTERETSGVIRVAVVGRPNVGKSSLVNALLGEERMIVSDIPGTTRDSVDSMLEVEGRQICIVDTAGIRRKGKTHLQAEKISVIHARKHMESSDVALLLLDPVEGVTHLDAAIGGYAQESGNAVILCVNKSDLIPKGEAAIQELRAQVRQRMKFLDYAPLLTFSAKTGKNLHTIFPAVAHAWDCRNRRVTTGDLNRFFQAMLEKRRIEALSTADVGVKYLTQVGTAPPRFVLFVNRGKKLHFSEKRFVENQLRAFFDFYANPIFLRERS